ncbi:hypothetical protein [Streptomyces sp. NPDC001415]
MWPATTARPRPCDATHQRPSNRRTRNYLRFVDVDRLLYNFRANHRLSTNGAAANGRELLAIANNSTAVGAFAIQDSDNGTADNRWRILK